MYAMNNQHSASWSHVGGPALHSVVSKSLLRGDISSWWEANSQERGEWEIIG